MTKIWVTTDGRPSQSANQLIEKCKQLGVDCGKSIKGGKITKNDILVNWGHSGEITTKSHPKLLLNEPGSVGIAVNKLKSFKRFREQSVSTPDWTTDPHEAIGWNCTVLARHKLTGHSGEGIEVIPKNADYLPPAPLYTRYIFKEREYRVHVFNDNVIDVQRKIRDPKREVVSWKVRSHQNGFIFARQGVLWGVELCDLARRAVNAINLDFGAVDIIEDKDGDLYVLEVNTAPGLDGLTLSKYADNLKNLVSGLNNDKDIS